MDRVLALWECVWLQKRELEVMHECLLLLPLCSSLPPQSAFCLASKSAEPSPLGSNNTAGRAAPGQAGKKILSGSHPAVMPTASTRQLSSSKQRLLWHKLT